MEQKTQFWNYRLLGRNLFCTYGCWMSKLQLYLIQIHQIVSRFETVHQLILKQSARGWPAKLLFGFCLPSLNQNKWDLDILNFNMPCLLYTQLCGIKYAILGEEHISQIEWEVSHNGHMLNEKAYLWSRSTWDLTKRKFKKKKIFPTLIELFPSVSLLV